MSARVWRATGALALVILAGLAVWQKRELDFLAGYWRIGDDETVVVMSPLPQCKDCDLLLISLDTLRADRLGFMGYRGSSTPNLDRIAGRSVVFENAFTNAYFTTPSHMTLFTSLYPGVHRVENRSIRLHFHDDNRSDANGVQLDPKYKTLAEVLQAAGFSTHWKAPLRHRFFAERDGFMRGFDHLTGPPFSRGFAFGGYKPGPFDVSALAGPRDGKEHVFQFFHTFLTHSPFLWRDHTPGPGTNVIPFTSGDLLPDFAARVKEKPSVLYVQTDREPRDDPAKKAILDSCLNFVDIRPCFGRFLSADGFWHALGQYQLMRASRVLESMQDEEVRRAELRAFSLAYDSGVTEVDKQMGELWRALESSGRLQRTLVVILSDHGEELFEHGAANHSTFHDHTARVPLLIFHPGAPAVRVRQLVSLIDVMPTILEILGLEGPPQMQGRAPWHGTQDLVFGSSLGTSYVRSKNWKLHRSYTGREELYFLPLDPEEQNNLIGFWNPVVQRAYGRLSAARAQWELGLAL